MKWIILGLIIGFVYFALWAIVRVGAKADEAMNKIFEERKKDESNY